MQKANEETQLLTLIEQIRRKIQRQKTIEQIVDEVEWERMFVYQIFKLIKETSIEVSNDKVLAKWKEMFAA